MIHHISAEHLTVDRVREILENNIKIDLSEDAKKRIVRCREYLDNKMETQKEPIYGITTGFGSLCNISIDKDQLSQLQKNLVMSHACGTGERVPAEIVKLMLLLKIQSLSYGNSGVQLETVQRLVDFFNNDVLPVVFQQGSLGASGDLAPLANMCLPLLGLGGTHLQVLTLELRREMQGIVTLGPLRRSPERDYVWNKTAPGPRLPPDIIEKTAANYREALTRLTGVQAG